MTHTTPTALRTRCLLCLAAALAQSGCHDEAKNAYAPPPPPVVFVATPQEREVTKYLSYTGVVEASQTVELRARVQGFLDKIDFSPGQAVKKGDLLFEIDPRQYEAAVDKASAEVRARKAALEGAKNDAKLAQELAEQRAGPAIDAITKAARRDAYAADVAQAEASLEEAELNLEYCSVHAPIDGRISRNLVDVGNLVGRSEPTLLASIVQATPAFVSVDISESDVLMVREERAKAGAGPASLAATPESDKKALQACELAIAGRADFEHKGQLDYVAPALDSQTGTLRVRAKFQNQESVLIPGLYVRLRFPLSARKAMLVPEAALLRDQEGRYAFIVSASDEVEVRRVQLGVLDGTMREVVSGLTSSDRVIVLGVLKARPGAKVAPQQQPQEGAAQGR